MSKSGIFWTKGTNECDYERTPPYPSFNALGVVVDDIWACYVDVHTSVALRERYGKATKEISDMYNAQNEIMKNLRKTIETQVATMADMEAELEKWKSQQGKGKRETRKIKALTGDVKTLFSAGVSKREIARQLNVSEGTIRRILASVCQGS